MCQLSVLILFCLLTFVLLQQAASDCSYQWMTNGDSCYKVIENPSTWAEGEKICETVGAALATIDSKEENSFVRTVAYNAKLQTNRIWLGGNNFVSGWAWLGDRLFNYTDWCPTYPKDYTAKCLAMTYDDSCAFKWSNVKCDDSMNIMCEKPYVYDYNLSFIEYLVKKNT